MLSVSFCVRGKIKSAHWLVAGCLFILVFSGVGQTWDSTSPVITNSLQARLMEIQSISVSHRLQLEGTIAWISPTRKKLALMDDFGGLIMETDLNPSFIVGRQLRISGSATILRKENVFRFGLDGLVLENDGLHGMTERSGRVLLEIGKIPFQMDWFNGTGPAGLEVSCEGPDFPLRKILDSELSTQLGPTNGAGAGLNFKSFEGWWAELPDFNRLETVQSGKIGNLDISVATRREGVGLQFFGFFEARIAGEYVFHIKSDDGSRLSIGKPNIKVEPLGQSELPRPKHIFIGQILEATNDGCWAQLEGNVTAIHPDEDGLQLELSLAGSHVKVVLDNSSLPVTSNLLHSVVRATGFCQGAYGPDGFKIPNLLLVPDIQGFEILNAAPTNLVASFLPGRPILTQAGAVHQMKRAEAQFADTAVIRGVVTSIDPWPPAFTVQDATGGIYVQGPEPVRVGEFVEVEGVVDPGNFAPMLMRNRIKRLGAGNLPKPVHPTWDQLMNGSLDAQYVELRGVVTSYGTDNVWLLTHGGTLRVQFQNGLSPDEIKKFENVLVQIRGVLLPIWDSETHQVKLGEIYIFNPVIMVDDSAPRDDSSIPLKTPGELLLFDAQASLFQRIKMAGQIIHTEGHDHFMMAGSNGVRFIASKNQSLKPGDLVEVTGYPQLGGAAPLLREAVARKLGEAGLPEPKKLTAGNLSNGQNDSTRVSVEGIFTGVRDVDDVSILELQSGAQNFVARLSSAQRLVHSLPIGSRLELTGVYAAQAGNSFHDDPVSAFQLLMDSPGQIKVLARPPWWNLRTLLIMVSALGGILVFALLWITQLRRKVEERTVQLQEQIEKRQTMEQFRAMEHERARIAQDLHDELGSSLTEIGMLATLPTSESTQHLDQIGERAGRMVGALDEIVWAMNPKHDSLRSLGSYLCLHADRFLKLANITCHLKGTVDLPDQPLNPIHRHEFFLAYKEALTNVVRHSGASEVRLSVSLIGKRLRLCLSDNGTGLITTPPTPGMDGLANMRSRLEKIGGRFAIASQSGRGTVLRFYLPLD